MIKISLVELIHILKVFTIIFCLPCDVNYLNYKETFKYL